MTMRIRWAALPRAGDREARASMGRPNGRPQRRQVRDAAGSPLPSGQSMPRTSAASVPGAPPSASRSHRARQWRAAHARAGRVSSTETPCELEGIRQAGEIVLVRSPAVDQEHSLELLDHGMERTARVVRRGLEDKASCLVADSPAQLVNDTRLADPGLAGNEDRLTLSPRAQVASAPPWSSAPAPGRRAASGRWPPRARGASGCPCRRRRA